MEMVMVAHTVVAVEMVIPINGYFLFFQHHPLTGSTSTVEVYNQPSKDLTPF